MYIYHIKLSKVVRFKLKKILVKLVKLAINGKDSVNFTAYKTVFSMLNNIKAV